jgi:hypothetical protein
MRQIPMGFWNTEENVDKRIKERKEKVCTRSAQEFFFSFY